MALINDPDLLSQGAPTTSTGVTFGAPTGFSLTMTAAATLPLQAAGDFFMIRESPDAQNNGLWIATGTPTTSSLPATKVTGAAPIAGGPDTIKFLGSTTTKMNIGYETQTGEIVLVKQNGLSNDGVNLQVVYSRFMIDFKDDAFLIANMPFPMFDIDSDAGKYIIGTNASGNNHGVNWFDSVTHSINTRKLLRNGGWTEVDTNGAILARWPSIVSIGTFEDPTADKAYYQFGTDTTVNDSVDFDFVNKVNEAVQAFKRLADGAINGGTGIAISASGRVLTRSDGGNWRTDGFKVGGRILFRDAENTSSNGDPAKVFGAGAFLLSAVGSGVNGAITLGTAAVATPNGFDWIDGGAGQDQLVRNDGLSWLDEGYFAGGKIVSSSSEGAANDRTATIVSLVADTINFATGTVTAGTDDNTVVFSPINPTGTPDITINAAVDNRNDIAVKLRVRDADANGKTYSQANLASVDKQGSGLGGFIFQLGVANVTDLKITETDANIDGNAPYTGMSLTFYTTPQSLGGAGANALVGGPYNFGMVLAANNGTDIQVHEWLQRQLRKTTDIDAGAGTVIGRTMDGLARFNGDAYEAGSTNGGLSFPRNPLGGGSGLMITGLNSASRNSTSVYDNTGAKRGFPIGTIVTIDYNQTVLDDPVAKMTLFYDRTIRTTVSDLVVTAGTGPLGTITSAGSNLPATLDAGVGAYIRLVGLTGVNAAMNGIYQVTSISTSSYSVIRKDARTIVTTTVASVFVDQHPIDSPDAIIVDNNVPADVVDTNPSADLVFTYDYSNNVQGGKAGGVDAFVTARAVGFSGAQYTQSAVSTIQSGIALTIPVSSQIERNTSNP